jgi:hypothetical protein
MVKIKLILAASSFAACTAAFAQSLGIYVENGELLNTAGDPVAHGDSVDGTVVNAFYGFVSRDVDLTLGLENPVEPSLAWAQGTLTGIGWNPMVDGTPAEAAFMTINGETFDPLQQLSPAVGQKPVLAFMNADGPASLEIGSSLAVAEGDPFLTQNDNRLSSVGTGAFNVIAGMEGSIQMVSVVPEPAHFAALFGLVGLGLVVIRRRRNR